MSENPVQKAKVLREQAKKSFDESRKFFETKHKEELSIPRRKEKTDYELKGRVDVFKESRKKGQENMFFTIDNPPCEIPDQKGFEDKLWKMIQSKSTAFRGEAYSVFFRRTIDEFNKEIYEKVEKDLRITHKVGEFTSYIADRKKRKAFMDWFKETYKVPFYPILTNDPFDIDTFTVWGTALIAHYVEIVHKEKARHIDNPKIHVRGFFYAFLQKGFCCPITTTVQPKVRLFNKTRDDYKLINKYITMGRYAGLIPYEWIEDAEFKEELEIIGGYPEKRGVFVSAKVVDKALPSIKGFTSVFYVEKTGIDSIINAISHTFPLIKVCSNKGELSVTLAHKILTKIAEEGKPAIIFMMTDYDPAGRLITMRAVRRLQGIAVQMKTKGIEIPSIKIVFLGLDREDIETLQRQGVSAGGKGLAAPLSIAAYENITKTSMPEGGIYELDALWALDDPVLHLLSKINDLLPTLVHASYDLGKIVEDTNEWYEKAKGVWNVYKDTEQGKTFSRQMGVPLEACVDTSLDSPCSIENMLDNVRQNYMKLLTESAQEFVNRINDIRIESEPVIIEDFSIPSSQDFRVVMKMPHGNNKEEMISQYYDNYQNLKKIFDDNYFGMGITAEVPSEEEEK